MITADHSITLVAFALHRPLQFVSFEPDPDLLGEWLAAYRPEMTFVKSLLADLNEGLRQLDLDANLFVGHSPLHLRIRCTSPVIAGSPS